MRREALEVAELETRVVPTLLGQQLFPLDNPWSQNISNAPVAANSAAIIAHIGAATRLTPNWYADNPGNGASPLYGIPFNVVHGNTTAKVNLVIDNYPGESDSNPVPIPANAVLEGDFQNGPNPNGAGYNVNQRGDSHLIVWDEDANVAYELYGVSRPGDATLFPNTSNVELPHSDGLWHAAQETVWNMNTDTFRTLGETSADAAGLSILAGLARPDEGLPVSQGGQGVIDHALRVTLPSADLNPQYIYPASHMVPVSSGSDNLPLGSRLRLANTPAIDTLISNMPPESQILAQAMQQYGLIVADIGSAMYVSGASASVDANNNISLTWDLTDIFASNGLETLNAGDFQVVNLKPIVTGLSAGSGAAGSTITITGQNFSGAAGNLSVLFGSTPAGSVNVLSDSQITAVVPNGSGTVDVTVQSGINETDTFSSNPNANVNAPIFGYGTSAATPADLFTSAASPPTIVLSTNALPLGSSTLGSAGSAQMFTVSGSNLTADIFLTAPAGVELSQDGGLTYGTSLDLPETGGTVSTVIDARISAAAPVGPISGTIAADSSGATEQDIPVNGTVNPASTTTAVSSSVNPSVFGQTITLTAEVTPGISGIGAPTGWVTFCDGTVKLQTIQVMNGAASMTISSFVIGTHTITAKYSGDSNFVGSVSPALNQVVQTVALESDAANPTKQDLVVGGTASADWIAVKKAGAGKVVIVVDQLAGGNFKFTGTFPVAGLARLVVYGGPGDNIITVDDAVNLPAVLLGGQGNNFIKGGGGSSVLVGGPKSDLLVGALGRSILIGGGGGDVLIARGGAVLLGGSTPYDTDLAALDALMAEWSRTDVNYQARVNDLLGPGAGGTAGGLNGPYYLDPANISSDGVKNTIIGGTGADLFFANPGDSIFGKKAGEKEILI
jgi:hypothetical protein